MVGMGQSLQLSVRQLEECLMYKLVDPESSPPFGWERVESSKLCIDKGRHRSAFHHSVNDAQKKKKENKTLQVPKNQKERLS